MRVLIVEIDCPQGRTLNAFFKAEGFVVEHTDSGEDALGLLRHYEFDMIIAGCGVPDMDGTRLISRARAAGHHTPVIAMLALASPKQRLAALSAGADDAVEHDTDRAELLARMRAILRRSRGYSQPVLRRGRLTLDQERQDISIDDKHIHLTGKEFALLHLLMMRKNMVMTKEAILSSLYGGMDEPEVKIIDVFVCKTRAKLAKAGIRNLIETVWGRGYVVRDASRDDEEVITPRVPQPIDTCRHEFAMA